MAFARARPQTQGAGWCGWIQPRDDPDASRAACSLGQGRPLEAQPALMRKEKRAGWSARMEPPGTQL